MQVRWSSSWQDYWTQQADGSYSRPCGNLEHSFYWDSVHNGVADLFEHAIIDFREGVSLKDILNPRRVARAWIGLKQLYPLIGARTEEKDGQVRFIVSTHNLSTVRPDEIIFYEFSCEQEIHQFRDNAIHGKRTLSVRDLARLYVLKQTDVQHRVHFISHIAHSITDGMAQATIFTTFLSMLATGNQLVARLEDRLPLAIPCDLVQPNQPRDSPLQRWRRAIALVLMQRVLKGGHTIPCRITTATPFNVPRSRFHRITFSREATSKILAGCKVQGITFGNAYPVINQAAITRLLFRHYMQGKIPQAEWEYRKIQPMYSGGPLNLRPMLDPDWYAAGGRTHVNASIGFFYTTLPYMPLGTLANARPDPHRSIPPFSTFLSRERFVLRSQMVRRQLTEWIRHPLYFERTEVMFPERVARIRANAIKWNKESSRMGKDMFEGEVIPLEQQGSSRRVFAHSGSSFGSIESMYPREYPLNRKQCQSPLFTVQSIEGRLHCRATELYVGSTTSQGQMSIFVYWDENVYTEDVVKELLDEVRGAVQWYLGGVVERNSTKL